MDYRKISEEIINRGKEKFEDLEVYIQTNKMIEIEVFNGELDKYSIAESGGLSLRGLHDEKMGYSYTEKIDKSSIDMLIQEAYENSKYIDSPDKEFIYSGSDNYQEIKNQGNLSSVSMERKIEFVKNLEKEALSLDKRVTSVQVCFYQEFESERFIMNSKGIDLNEKSNGAACALSIIVKDGDDTKTGMSYRIFYDFDEVTYKEIAKEAVEEGLSLLGAKPIKSDSYKTVVKNTVFANLLSAFGAIFSAETVQKGLSLLKDKVNQEIGSSILNIVEDPFMEKGFKTTAFDDEGHKTVYKKIVENGVLKTYFHNLKTAYKDGVESTGNGSRGSYKSSLSVAPTNVFVEKGEKSFDELIKDIEKGVYITDVQGLHSGINQVSGDYSLSASGYEIENGKITRPINQITMAGNFFETLKNIEDIGNDLEFNLPMYGYIGSPSIKLTKLSISGE